MTILIQLAFLVAGFLLLVKGADWFVEGAAGIAEKTGLSPLIIGLTIVAMGTSAPEAAISIASALKGSAGIAVGNVLGSNIMNILLVLGITALITPLAVKKSSVRYEIPFVINITIILALLGNIDNVLGRVDGIILWLIFICYLGYLFIMAKFDKDDEEEVETVEEEDEGEKKVRPVWLLILFLIVGGALIVFGSDITVDAATRIAEIIGISDRIIGLTIVAFGTSLPELVTCVVAALKKNVDIAVGNIVGSNIFNVLFVLGTSAIIKPIEYGNEFLFDSVICIGAVVLLLLCIIKNRELKRLGGAVMLLAYALYFTYIIVA